MMYVYLLRSVSEPERKYTGCTRNLKTRIACHNAGQNPSTSRNRPWELVCYIAFRDDDRARAFEQYLKSGSGRTFAKRHLQ
jgi:predicted GIY-YIG superfamily endonuclease